MGETNGNEANGKSKLEMLLPSGEVIVKLNDPNGDPTDVSVVFAGMDGRTKTQWDRTIARLGKRGRFNYEAGNFFLFDRKCTRIEGLTAEDCGGIEPKDFFRNDDRGHILLNAAVNEYLNRVLPSADDGTKS